MRRHDGRLVLVITKQCCQRAQGNVGIYGFEGVMTNMRWTVMMVVVVVVVVLLSRCHRRKGVASSPLLAQSLSQARTALVIAAKVPPLHNATPWLQPKVASGRRLLSAFDHLRGPEAPHLLLHIVSPRSHINCDAIDISLRRCCSVIVVITEIGDNGPSSASDDPLCFSHRYSLRPRTQAFAPGPAAPLLSLDTLPLLLPRPPFPT